MASEDGFPVISRSSVDSLRLANWALGVLFCGLLLGMGCGAKMPDARPAATNSASLKPLPEVAPTDSSIPEYLPQIAAHDGYVGSSSCRACHAEEHASWYRSFHRSMTQFPTPDSVKANFNHVTLTNEETRFILLHDADRFGVRVEKITPPNPGEAPTEPVQIVLGLVTGSHHMQVFWLPNGSGNCQVGFPFTWLIPEQRWVPRTMTFLRPPDASHRQEVWNAVCIRCHATGMEPHFRPSQGRIATQVAELGIACEACHGPAKQHVDFANSQVQRRRAELAAVTNWQIIQPLKLSPERGSQICGSCHSMKWLNPQQHWFDQGFSYRPGDDLEATTPVIRQNMPQAPGALVEYLQANPDVMNDFFWSDGMIRVSGREYNGLIESPCYRGGKFTCFSCHSMHQSAPDDQLAAGRSDARACTQCHAKYDEPSARSRHTHHAANSSGSDCYNCHLPHTTYGVLSAIRSHTVSNPRVADQLATGRPNACNLCHLDQTLAWTTGWLRDWYRQPLPALLPSQSSVAEGVRLALAGDAGQRVLLAWHFGWEPALAVSGREWTLPVLGELMDDPYAAVRCVAERSLRGQQTKSMPGYDFTLEPRTESLAAVGIWSLVGTSPADAVPERSARTGIRLAEPAETRQFLQSVKSQRVERPLRLRE